MDSYYDIGVVHKVTIEGSNGQIIEIGDAEVSVTIESETLPHYAATIDGRRLASYPTVNQTRKVEVKTREDVRQELFRLIRSD